MAVHPRAVIVCEERELKLEEIMAVKMHLLAERFDVPGLRRACYQRIRGYYQNNNTLPSTCAMEVVIRQCSQSTLLWKYLVSTIAHAIISGPDKRVCDGILDIDKDFAAQVAIETMNRIRCSNGSIDPDEQECYEDDDSDSDIPSSINDTDIEDDSDGDMTLSNSEVESSCWEEASTTSHNKPLQTLESAIGMEIEDYYRSDSDDSENEEDVDIQEEESNEEENSKTKADSQDEASAESARQPLTNIPNRSKRKRSPNTNINPPQAKIRKI
jgi:hypothetical protein